MSNNRIVCSVDATDTVVLAVVRFPVELTQLTGFHYVVRRLRRESVLFRDVQTPADRPCELLVALSDQEEALRRLQVLMPGFLSAHTNVPKGTVFEWADGACSLVTPVVAQRSAI